MVGKGTGKFGTKAILFYLTTYLKLIKIKNLKRSTGNIIIHLNLQLIQYLIPSNKKILMTVSSFIN